MSLAEPPVCPYCHQPSVFLSDSTSLYGGRDFGPAYACTPCGAWVGCHKGTQKPLGRLADKYLRKAKMDAHAEFDPLWQRKMERDGLTKKQARAAGYAWLAVQMGIDPADCNIGMFDRRQCVQVADLCRPFNRARQPT